MANELDKVISKLGITVKAREQPGTPSRGFPNGVTLWRVTLERKVKGEDKPIRLVLSLFTAAEPTTEQVLACLRNDLQAGELTLWDFAQAYNGGNTDGTAERMHKASKRVAPRVKKFFGEGWPKVAATLPKAA
jgi:hypothetical protein